MPQRRGRPTKKPVAATDTINTEGLSLSDLGDILAKALERQAIEPNMLAYKPHAKQVIFHSSKKKAKLYIGGNRSGKTTGGVIEDLWWCTKRHPYRELPAGPIRGRVIGVDFVAGVGQILLPEFKRWIVPSDLVNGSWEDSWNNQDRTLNFANGSFLEFKSYDQELEKHAGTSRHFIHYDEEPPKDIFNENSLRLADTEGSWWITMTPVNGMTWVYDTLYEPDSGPDEDLEIIKVHIDENPYVTEEGKKVAFKFLDENERKARSEGAFVQKGGLVFKDWRDGSPYVVDNWRPPNGQWRIYESLDHGINHPAVILWHAVAPDGRVVTFHEYYESDKTIGEDAAYLLAFRRKNNITPWSTVGDPAGNQRQSITGTSVIQEYGRCGVYVATEGIPRSLDIGLDKMQSYLRIRNTTNAPTWFITRDCVNLRKEMKHYHWDTYDSSKSTEKNAPKQTPKKKLDDAIDCARYFFTQMPDLTPEPLDAPIKSFDPGTLIHTAALMAQAPPDAHRPVQMDWGSVRYDYDSATTFAGLED